MPGSGTSSCSWREMQQSSRVLRNLDAVASGFAMPEDYRSEDGWTWFLHGGSVPFNDNDNDNDESDEDQDQDENENENEDDAYSMGSIVSGTGVFMDEDDDMNMNMDEEGYPTSEDEVIIDAYIGASRQGFDFS